MRSIGLLVMLAACNGSELVPPDAAVPRPDAPLDAPATGLSITPATHAFGNVEIASSSPALALVVSTGTTTGALSVSVTGTNASELVVSSNTCSGASLAPEATCTVYVALQPGSVGAKSAQVNITGSPGGTVAATITATAVIPAQRQSITPATHDFGTAPAGGFTLVPQRFTVTNTGSASVGPMTAMFTGSGASQFQRGPNTCAGQINAPGASCTVDVYFSPTTVGPKSASIVILPLATTVATLSGTGVEPPRVVIAPTSHDFGTVFVGASSAVVDFTVRNDGLGTTGVMALSTGNPVFEIMPGNTCDGAVLAPNQSCSASVRFSPDSDGARQSGLLAQDEIFLTFNSLSGTGVVLGNPTLAPSSYQFGSVTVGSASAPQTFTLTNTESFTTAPFSISLDGFAPSQFRIVSGSDHCTGVALAPNASCTVDVAFTPTVVGAMSASLRAVAGPGGLVFASLQGTGVP